MAAVCRRKFSREKRDQLADIYPTAEDARIVVAIVHAAAIVRDLNFKYMQERKGAPVTARFDKDGIAIVDPLGKIDRIYAKPL
jgi:predicted transcriptional regulator